MRRLATLGLAAAVIASPAATALGQGLITYPQSNSAADVAAWLKRDTPLQAGQVVDLAASAVTAIMSSQPTREPKGFIAVLHAEALDPAIQAQEGIVSWSIPVEIDCTRRKVRLGAMTGFPGRDLRESPRPIRDADTDWVSPSPRAPLDSVLKALCDPRFHRPLSDLPKVAAQAADPPKAPAVAPAKPLPAPAAESRKPAVAAAQPAPRPAAPAASEPRRTAPSSGGVTASVQIGASPSEAEIKSILAKAKKKFPADLKGLRTDAVAVTVDQKVIYRALISGFHTAAEANGLCETLKGGGQACFVRK